LFLHNPTRQLALKIETKSMARIFLAGASGAVGRRLVRLLTGAGHQVTGTTRSPANAAELSRLGIEPAIVDMFDAQLLSRVVMAARPEIVIHQLTDLPPGLDPAQMGEAIVRNARVRDEGTRNLVDAALAAGARRLVAQSIAWAYAPSSEPHVESDPLDAAAEGDRGISVRGVIALERWVLNSPPLRGVVLRYGRFYGPGTGRDGPYGAPALHVDAAAQAALLAADKDVSGIFNIAEDDGHVATDRARDELGWSAAFRLPGS
jgi:nucleoside-diphosphate-sugar epimerase